MATEEVWQRIGEDMLSKHSVKTRRLIERLYQLEERSEVKEVTFRDLATATELWHKEHPNCSLSVDVNMFSFPFSDKEGFESYIGQFLDVSRGKVEEINHGDEYYFDTDELNIGFIEGSR